MGLLFFALIVAIILLIALVSSRNRGQQSSTSRGAKADPLTEQWVRFIAAYGPVAKTKAEKRLVQTMLDDLNTQGFAVPAELLSTGKTMSAPKAVPAGAVTPPSQTAIPAKPQGLPVIELDNISILLYLGAFLFVASVGLFVAFGGFSGVVRTVAVAVVALVLYICGVWLYKRWAKLAQAGLAFAGIGLATAPFVGLAAYSFAFHHTSGALVWLLTSLACLGLYAHALLVLRKPLLNYLLIFTFLSLIESGVSVINAPIYYFGWGLSALGLALVLLSRMKGFDKELLDASNGSARFFIPLASIGSLVMIGNQGAGQFGVSLLLAAAYYMFEFAYGRREERTVNALVAQVAATGAVGALAYGVRPDLWVAAAAILAACVLQALVVLKLPVRSELADNFASIAVTANIAAVLLAYQKPGLVVIALIALVIHSVIVWLRQARADAYCVAAVAWMVLPLVLGQLYLQPHLTIAQQASLSLVALMAQAAVLVALYKHQSRDWQQAAKVVYILAAASVLVIAFAATPLLSVLGAFAVAATFILMAERTPEPDWAVLAGIASVLPVVTFTSGPSWFAGTVAAALVANLGLTLRYRQELTHWLWSAALLVLPVAVGTGCIGYWTPAEFAWAYVAAMVGFIFARSVARGLVPMLKQDARWASLSYVVGYCAAGAGAIIASLFSTNSQLHTSLVLVVIGLAAWYIAVKVERQPDILASLPLVAQAVLLSAVRPDVTGMAFDYYLAASTGIAVLGYVLPMARRTENKGLVAIRQGSLVSGLVTPFSFAFAGETHLMMPIGLLAFAGMVFAYVYKLGQKYREWVGGLALLGVWWLMWFLGVRNVQAYSHVLAALFAAYAFWRYMRREIETSDRYLVAMLATATVPLVLQALAGTAGDVYGWWLLLEQIFFMLLGMLIRKRFVIWWGLFVTVGAVMYQLRHLGWAALTVLALFLIGLAIFQLQKQNKQR